MPQAQAADQRQGREKAIDQAARAEQPQRKQHALFVLDGFEVGERDQRAHVGGRKHVLRRLRHFQSDRLGAFQRRIPQMREIADDEPGLARAQAVQVLEHRLAVVERAEGVDHHDEVEWSGQRPDESGVLDVADEKRQIGMGLARLRDHALAEIHADAERRLERGEQIAGAASELEHAGAVGNQKLEIAQILMVEERGALQPVRRSGALASASRRTSSLRADMAPPPQYDVELAAIPAGLRDLKVHFAYDLSRRRASGFVSAAAPIWVTLYSISSSPACSPCSPCFPWASRPLRPFSPE